MMNLLADSPLCFYESCMDCLFLILQADVSCTENLLVTRSKWCFFLILRAFFSTSWKAYDEAHFHFILSISGRLYESTWVWQYCTMYVASEHSGGNVGICIEMNTM
jgi:hypothetical protein